MYSLLIVDDEKWVREGLRLTIDWESEGIQLLGEAADGEEALKSAEAHGPDIIITDIKMPGMDGIALIETLAARKLPSKVIIISGYSDFNYAQKALKCGAFDYVLKPIEETNILEVVRRCVAVLEKERTTHDQKEKMSNCIRESLPLARQRYLEMILLGETMTLGNVQTQWDVLNINLDPDHLIVVTVKIYNWGTRGKEKSERPLIRYALGNMAEEIGSKWGSTVACPLHNHEDVDLVILQSAREPHADKDQFINNIVSFIQAAHRYLDVEANIGVSRERTRTMLSQSFEEAVYSAAYAFYDGYGKIYNAAELPKMSNPLQEYSGLEVWETRLVHAVKLGDEKILMQSAQEIVNQLRSSRDKYSPLVLQRALTLLLQKAVKKIKLCYPLLDTQDSCVVPELQLPLCTLAELKYKLWETLMQFNQVIRTLGNRKKVIDSALKYIEEHFMEGIMMNDVAERHYLNPSYFSKVFHEEMGETFSKYLQRIRVEKAKGLLKLSSLKIYEVATQVGYNDFRHFTKMFKEAEGITPMQYRDSGIH